jgi:hypothetical protein
MPNTTTYQCPNCGRWFNTPRSLKLHITSCRVKHFGEGGISENDNHLPIKSIRGKRDINEYDSQINEIEVNRDNFDEGIYLADNMSSIASNKSLFGDTSSYSDAEGKFYPIDDYDHLGKRTTAITKLQVKFNDIINNHKASLKMHDDIVHIFNEYISSPYFDKYATLKTQKSFIQLMETSLNVTHLRPKPTNVKLHDGSEQIVPVFDAKAMILDILTNRSCMQEQNLAPGYDVFTGDVDEKHIDNQRYGEIHTGDSWLPARDRFVLARRMNQTCQLD